MKKVVAITLLLVLVLGLCAPALAGKPTVSFASGKNKWIRYNSSVTWKVKYNSSSYKRVKNVAGGYIWRAGFTINIKSGSYSEKPFDIDFTGKGNVKCKFYPRYSSVVFQPPYGYYTKWKVTLQGWYRPTYGYTVYAWKKCGGAKKTNLYVKN